MSEQDYRPGMRLDLLAERAAEVTLAAHEIMEARLRLLEARALGCDADDAEQAVEREIQRLCFHYPELLDEARMRNYADLLDVIGG